MSSTKSFSSRLHCVSKFIYNRLTSSKSFSLTTEWIRAYSSSINSWVQFGAGYETKRWLNLFTSSSTRHNLSFILNNVSKHFETIPDRYRQILMKPLTIMLSDHVLVRRTWALLVINYQEFSYMGDFKLDIFEFYLVVLGWLLWIGKACLQ